MKKSRYNLVIAAAMALGVTSCTDLDEKVYSQIGPEQFYQDENSVKGAVASIYNDAAQGYSEKFFFLQELSADQLAWRCWYGGLWGYDDGEKYVLSTHSWNANSVIIKQSWNEAWQTIGLCNDLMRDLGSVSAGMTDAKKAAYIAEIRTLRAWAYYNVYEIWGPAIPLYTENDMTSASADYGTSFEEGQKKVYNFLVTELDESLDALPVETGNGATHTVMNQALNRLLKARVYLNSQIFFGEDHFTECENICDDILAGKYGKYELEADWRTLYDLGNEKSPEIIFAFGMSDGLGANQRVANTRMTMYAYNIWDYCSTDAYDEIGAWNCVCLTPSFDNSGTVQPLGGTDNPKCFLDAPYGDKLGAVYERFLDGDSRKQPYTYLNNKREGMFLIGLQKANFGTGETLKADAERDGQDLVYVDQVGTFMEKEGHALETVQSSRWGETNSGYRLMKYPLRAKTDKGGYKDISEVEFRLAEVYYMKAECRMRAGDAAAMKSNVDKVLTRYFTDKSKLDNPGRGFSAFDMDWMLSQWGIEFLSEGRRRRTDLRRFDKFTQGQWWFFGRTEDPGVPMPAKRDRKYEWFPLPADVIAVNPELVQNPGY